MLCTINSINTNKEPIQNKQKHKNLKKYKTRNKNIQILQNSQLSCSNKSLWVHICFKRIRKTTRSWSLFDVRLLLLHSLGVTSEKVWTRLWTSLDLGQIKASDYWVDYIMLRSQKTAGGQTDTQEPVHSGPHSHG